MIRTFEFLFHLQRSKKDRQTVLAIMNSGEDAEFEYKGWHLHFESGRKWVQITDNGKDMSLTRKFVPAELSYEPLISLINKEGRENLEARCLE